MSKNKQDGNTFVIKNPNSWETTLYTLMILVYIVVGVIAFTTRDIFLLVIGCTGVVVFYMAFLFSVRREI